MLRSMAITHQARGSEDFPSVYSLAGLCILLWRYPSGKLDVSPYSPTPMGKISLFHAYIGRLAFTSAGKFKDSRTEPSG